MRRSLSDSVYLWACGEKADEDDDPQLFDRLIGWLILLVSLQRRRILNSVNCIGLKLG